MISLTLLTRPGCHLCEEMLVELEPLIAGRAKVDIVDISEDNELSARYGLLIPVLKHGDEELCRYRLDRDRITGLLERPHP